MQGLYLFFLFLLQNIDCGYSLVPPSAENFQFLKLKKSLLIAWASFRNGRHNYYFGAIATTTTHINSTTVVLSAYRISITGTALRCFDAEPEIAPIDFPSKPTVENRIVW